MSPKKKKTAPKNSFYFYMMDFKRKKEAEGFIFPGGLKEVSELASPSWKGLDPKSKQHFENVAERAKASGNGGVRYTTQGKTYEEVDREKREMEQKKEEMLITIKRAVRTAGREGLKHRHFYFMHVNYYCKAESPHFVPCELSMLAYNVQEGYLPNNLYHTFIDPGLIPQGFSFRAKTHSEATHKTPLPPNAMGCKDYQQIYDSIISLVQENGDFEDDGRPPPVFTLSQCIPEVVDTLDHLKDYSSHHEGFFRVFPIEELFFEMKNFGLKPDGQRLFFNGVEDKGFPFISNAEEIMHNDTYGYSGGIACDYHDEQDVRQHCSRSYVIRWSFLFSDHLCANLDVKIISERHTPRGTNLNAIKITTQLDQLKLSQELRQSCGRGKPVDGRAVPTSRKPTTFSPNLSHNESTSRAGSERSYATACGSPASRSTEGDVLGKPRTIIDHVKFQTDDTVPYVPKSLAPDAPLRKPKEKGKCIVVNAVQSTATPTYDGSNFPSVLKPQLPLKRVQPYYLRVHRCKERRQHSKIVMNLESGLTIGILKFFSWRHYFCIECNAVGANIAPYANLFMEKQEVDSLHTKTSLISCTVHE